MKAIEEKRKIIKRIKKNTFVVSTVAKIVKTSTQSSVLTLIGFKKKYETV